VLIGLELDHVIVAVADLRAGAREIEVRYGLTSVEGGRHPGWGTANRIVPLGETYIELVSVVDEAGARESPFGRWVAAARSGRLLGWAVRTTHLDAVARRLELTVDSGSRTGRDGRLVRWRLAGVEQAAAEPFLPFFIEWGPQTSPPGKMHVTHRVGAAKLATVHLVGDADRLAAWLGDGDGHPAITVRAGPPTVESIVVTRSSGGEAVISSLPEGK
jgi:Glyoxalase-like domain